MFVKNHIFVEKKKRRYTNLDGTQKRDPCVGIILNTILNNRIIQIMSKLSLIHNPNQTKQKHLTFHTCFSKKIIDR